MTNAAPVAGAQRAVRLSAQGAIDIISHEAICLDPYLDSVGVWTIGIGQTKSDDLDPRTMGRLTIQQAIDLFQRKIMTYTAAVDGLQLKLTQNQYDALTSFCYNTGPGNLRKLCRNRTIPEIGDAMMLYTIPKEVTARRQKEQRLFQQGKYDATDGLVLVVPVVGNKPRYKDGYKLDVRPFFSPAPAPVVAVPAPPTTPPTPAIPSPSTPAPGSVGAKIASWWSSLFSRKA